MISFTKSIKEFASSTQVKVTIWLAFAYCLMFNSAVLWHKFTYLQGNNVLAIAELLKDFICDWLVLIVVIGGLTINRLLLILGSLFLFITGAAASYYLFFFSIAPNKAVIVSIFGTHNVEVAEMVSWRMIAWCVVSVIICLSIIKRYPLAKLSSGSKALAFSLLALTLYTIYFPRSILIRTHFPIQYLHNTYRYFFQPTVPKELLTSKYTFKDNSDADVVGVLIVGESARYINFGVNGYERNNTPNLSKLDLKAFKTRSCASSTCYALPCLLSRYGEDQRNLVETETSFLEALTKLNFNTMWFGTQTLASHYRGKKANSFYEEVKFYMIPGRAVIIGKHAHDGLLLPHLHQNLVANEKKFIVLHMTGSHWNYRARYPNEFAKYQPEIETDKRIDPASCTYEQRVNSYDNSILYTDYFINEVIESLKDKNALVIYTSDHGESLGERGILTHSSEEYVPEQRVVPLFVWFSDQYKANHPDKWEAVSSMVGQDISHDFVFHSVLDCLNIESDAIDKNMSLCSKKQP